MMIAKADHKRYSELKTELLNEYTLKSNKYPKPPIETIKILNNYRNRQERKQSTNTSVSFAQKGKQQDNAWHKDAICHLCKKKGHIKPNCPNKKKPNDEETGKNNLTIGIHEGSENGDNTVSEGNYSFLTGVSLQGSNINKRYNGMKNWILLDNQSTVDVFCNSKLLKKIWVNTTPMHIDTNGGRMTCTQKALLHGYGEVWYNKNAITNILSLKNVKDKYPVTYNSETGNMFIVHKPEKNVIFQESSNGLWYHDTNDKAMVFLNTVNENKLQYSNREIQQANIA